MRWGSVSFHFGVTVTLTCDLISSTVVSVAYLLHYLRKESQIWCVGASWDGRVSCIISGSL